MGNSPVALSVGPRYSGLGPCTPTQISKLHLPRLHAALEVLLAALPRPVVDDRLAGRRSHRAVGVGRPLHAEVD
eukprot:scaffold32084_cov51-Phaeocystis_antarctica.AAC.3